MTKETLVVYKYTLQPHGITTLILPKKHQILNVEAQYSNPCLWALIEAGATEFIKVDITCYHSGETIETPTLTHQHVYLGTCLLSGGSFVLHYFQIIPK